MPYRQMNYSESEWLFPDDIQIHMPYHSYTSGIAVHRRNFIQQIQEHAADNM